MLIILESVCNPFKLLLIGEQTIRAYFEKKSTAATFARCRKQPIQCPIVSTFSIGGTKSNTGYTAKSMASRM